MFPSRTEENAPDWALLLGVRDLRPGFVSHPCLSKIFIGQRANFRALHDHTRTGIPSQDGIVVSRRSKIDSLLVVCHCFLQSVICGGTASRAALANSSMSHALPNQASVIGLFVLARNLSQNLLSRLCWNGHVKLVGSCEEE